MTDPKNTVLEFIATWRNEQALHTGLRQYLLPDAVWENVGFSRTVGPEEAIDLMKKVVEQGGPAMANLEVEIVNIIAEGDIVMTERSDHMVDDQGNRKATIRVVGVFHVKDGKIAAWRDYFDTAPHKH